MKTGKKLNVWLVVCVFLLVVGRTCFAGQIIYVDADAPGYYGSSWADACHNLKDAFYFAQYGYGDEIRVAQGVYKPADPGGDRGASFELITGVTVKGGYAGYGEPDPNARDIEKYETILSGDLWGNDVEVAHPADLLDEPSRADNSYNVVTVGYGYSGGPPVLDGFTITGGNANGGYFPNSSGGGIVMDGYDVGVIITDCIFINNSAAGGAWPATGGTGAGGAIALDNSRGIFTRCWFIRNAAEGDGGAVCMDGCGTCQASYAEFKDCRFINNYTGGDGGALYNSWPTLANFLNCIVAGNVAEGSGGGLYHRGDWAFLVNCTFSGNRASNGGGIYNQASHSGFWPTLTNCILWGNVPEQISTRAANAVNITYSDIEGGWFGSGNIDTNPCFVSPGYWDANGMWVDGDYYLLPGSACIDAGDPNYVAEPSAGKIPTGYYFYLDPAYIDTSSEFDLDGEPRVIGGRVDMGAFECRPTIVAEAKIAPHNINLTGKGKWITCYIRLPEGYDVADIQPGSIRLEDTIRPLWMWFDEAKQVTMVKFKRYDVQQVLEPDDVELTVSGELEDGTLFEVTITVNVVGKVKKD